jgi:hypothetical protein
VSLRGDLKWLEVSGGIGAYPLRVNFCRAISRNARLLYPTKLPRRPFAVEAVSGHKRTSRRRPGGL